VKGFLLDTNVISELRRPRPHDRVVNWLRGLDEDHVHVCAVSVGELQRGIERTRRSDPGKAGEIERWLEALVAGRNILPMDAAAFREWARLMEGRSATLLEDAMIAAIARVWGLTVATRNEADFAALETAHVNPFKG